MKQTQNFTEGRIFAPLVRFSLPVLLALFLQTMYGAVDLLVVGKFGTAADVSAVSTGSMVMHTVTPVITSLAMGLTVLVGRKIGEGCREEAGKIIGSGIWLFAILAVVVSVAMVFAASATARIMQAPEEAFDETVAYITICSAGTVFIVAYNLVGSPLFVMLQGIIGAFGIRLPMSWIVSRQAAASLFHIGLATPASSLVQIILCGVYFAFAEHRRKQGR